MSFVFVFFFFKEKEMNKMFMAAVVVAVFAVFCMPALAEETFSITWSEYPSWSVFGVAGTTRVNGELLVDGKKGSQGALEKKWNVDIELREADYDTCILQFGSGQCDASCLTNMDVLNPALGLPSVAIMPTSTSYGADACIVVPAISSLKQLRGNKIYGLAKSVSEYAFVRCLVINGEDEKNFKFTNMDPQAAATAMQQRQAEFKAIMVWNPFVMQTLKTRKDARNLFDSTSIPGEITDMVVMSQKSLARKDGKNAACCIADIYYTICKMLADPAQQDEMLVALGEKFSHLNAKEMAEVVRQTRFYATPEQGIHLFTGGGVFPWKKNVEDTSVLFTNQGFLRGSKEVSTKSHKEVMALVMDFCVSHGIVPQKPSIAYGSSQETGNVQLRFDPSYMKEVLAYSRLYAK